MMGKLLLIFSIFALSLTGCQTNMKKAFDEVKPGMDKDQVLEIIGGPRAVTRFHGKDRWFISFYADGVRYEREIHFSNGIADYVGETYQPPEDNRADVVDKKNEEDNQKVYQELIESRKKMGQAADEYDAKVKGTDKVRYVPQFEQIK
jgi:outer membrane protein assembly factor BamE